VPPRLRHGRNYQRVGREHRPASQDQVVAGAAPYPKPGLPSGTITFLFTDVEGSTSAWLRNANAMGAALARHDALIEHLVAEHHGHVVRPRGEGDSRFAVFGRASEALAAACAIQLALVQERWPLKEPMRVRMALHTGEADLRLGDYYGPAVNHCARLRAVSHGGQVVVSSATAELVREALPDEASLRDLGVHQLKDLDQPETVWQLVHPKLRADFPLLMSLSARRHNLPNELSSFVGRDQAIGDLSSLLESNRLLTLTGHGGVGKTRLALRVAAQASQDYADGVWLVRLDAVDSPDLVPSAVAAALDVQEQAGRPLVDCLVDAVGSRHVLLVLDNCEHVILAGAELVHALLESCPQLHIIATSREPLNVAGECAWRVPSLSLPTPGDSTTAEHVHRSEAVRLFVERAMLIRPGFALTSQNAAALAHICRRLDGIPLAIELAAARVKTLSLAHLAQRLDDSFDLLTGGSRTALPRHQTLRAAIDSSYDRLSLVDRMFLQRLAVFSGAWTLETSEAVCSGNGIPPQDVLGRVSVLVDRSLVTVEEHGGIEAYRLLEPIRQYSLERLVESGESEVFNRRLATYMADFVERAEFELPGPQHGFWLDRLEQEHESVRTALRWAVGHDLHVALRLAVAAWPFWEARLYLREGKNWLEQVVDLAAGQEAFALLRARALGGLAVLVRLQGDTDLAGARLVEALATFRRLGDRGREAFVLNGLGLLALETEDVRSAVGHFEESATLWRAVGNRQELAYALLNLAHAVELQGDQVRARSLLEESLRVRRELGNNRGFLPAILALARLAGQRQDREGALALLRECLTLVRPLGWNRSTISILDGLASFALRDGQFLTAVRLLGTAESMPKSVDFRPLRRDQPHRLQTIAAAQARLSDNEYATAWVEGKALTPEEAITQAMAVLDPHPSDPKR